SLVHSLQSSSRYFVANDRFFVSDTPVGLIASGMPTIVRIRSGTLRLFPQLAERAEAVPYHRERTLNEIQNHPGPPSRDEEASSFSQAQFLKILGRTALTRSPLQSILFPVRDDSLQAPVFVPLTVEDVTRQLMMNLLSPGPRLLTSEVFDPSSDREIPREQIEQMCRRIASRTSCHQYRQGLQTISLPASLPALSHCA
ncbi:MAG: hypothetical protein KDA79_17420, partial [Planctomycetaceae bacterium]|nr:hypothetical protein [Planctomycetaceae bacterium]